MSKTMVLMSKNGNAWIVYPLDSIGSWLEKLITADSRPMSSIVAVNSIEREGWKLLNVIQVNNSDHDAEFYFTKDR